MRLFLLIMLLLFAFERGVNAQSKHYYVAQHVTHSDVDFFFSSISFTRDECQFKLSPNTIGMIWRIKTDKTDVTGACESGQILTIPASASLEIKRKDLNLYFLPTGPGAFNVRFRIKPESGVSKELEEREATVLKVMSNGGYTIANVEE